MRRMQHFPAIGESHCATVKLVSVAFATDKLFLLHVTDEKGLIIRQLVSVSV